MSSLQYPLLNSLKLPCAALVCALWVTGSQGVCAQVTWKRGEALAKPPAFSQGPRSQELRGDKEVMQVAFLDDAPPAEASSPGDDPRLLGAPSREQIASPAGGSSYAASRKTPFAMPKIDSFSTAASGLAIVVGLFLVCMWMLRRAGPKPTSPLPSDAVAVLGRVPLAARNFAHLLQVGNKLVLVAITPDGVAPITEITDPLEVQRMLGLCLRNGKQSTTAEFHDVLEKLSKEPASGFLENKVLGKQAAAYSSQGRA